MKFLSVFTLIFFFTTNGFSQFQPTKDGLIIMVSDGTENGRDSKLTGKGDIPASYEYTDRKTAKGAKKNTTTFTEPIRPLGMTECIQAAAFLERPEFGKKGYLLIFSLNDSIGGKQGTLEANGKTYKGVYRIVRQKSSSSEKTPKGMTNYRMQGTFFLLGIS